MSILLAPAASIGYQDSGVLSFSLEEMARAQSSEKTANHVSVLKKPLLAPARQHLPPAPAACAALLGPLLLPAPAACAALLAPLLPVPAARSCCLRCAALLLPALRGGAAPPCLALRR